MPFLQSHTAIQSAVEAELASLARFGVDLGLSRIEKLLANMGSPHLKVPIIHVAGTNGKGSVCAYLASVLTAAGYKTGRYTSPHLVNWTERISIDDVPISWQALQTHLSAVKVAMDSIDCAASLSVSSSGNLGDSLVPTQFEVFTAAAWQYFAKQRVDIAVVEVGLGGRLDATNVCSTPLATVIVSISRDHWQRLGNTLAEITGEKAGILKPGVRAIAGPLPPEAQAVVTARAAELNVPLTWVTPAKEVTREVAQAASVEHSVEHSVELMYDGIRYPQALLGDHQKVNSACAIATLQALRAQGWQISDDAIASGMANVQWPGRLHKSQWQGHALLIDGAHNEDSARSLRAYLDKTCPHQPITWLMGLLDTKDPVEVFTALLREGDQLHLVPVPGHSSADPQNLMAIAQQICPTLASATVHLDLLAGLVATTQLDSPLDAQLDSQLVQSAVTVLCGSLYLIGHFYEHYAT